MQWPSLPPTTLPTSKALNKDLAAFQKATAYFNNNGTELDRKKRNQTPSSTPRGMS